MDALAQLVLICLSCMCARAEPLGDALRRHSRHGVYARGYSRDYEPYMFAAVPLHAPVPVLRVLSSVPLGARERLPAPSAHHAVYARAPYSDAEYEAAAYESQQYASNQYASQYAAAPYAKHFQASQLYASASSAPEEPTILYARPSPTGGYTYHTSPNKHSAKRAPPSDAPYIIRVHKYRIVKER